MAGGGGRRKAKFSAALGGLGDNYKGNLSSIWGAIDRMDTKKGDSGGGGSGGGGSGGGSGGGGTPDIENPPLPPVDGSRRDVWEDTVNFYFPKVGMKDGGLVRGAGKAVKGRGRGKMV